MRTPSRILIVDDNPTNVKVLQTRLAAEGYEVLTAADGEEGLAAARQHIPDLILLDVMMPKLDGFEVCRRLRADAAFPFTPIIMVTAMADSKDVIAGLEAGGDEYLTKPVDHAALAARVRSMLRIKRLHDTVETLAAEVKEWNASLERRVAEQVGELEIGGVLGAHEGHHLDVVIESAEHASIELGEREFFSRGEVPSDVLSRNYRIGDKQHGAERDHGVEQDQVVGP